ncbi:MAG: tetratricopeptide repeat protein, partial [Planctomycetia bacterium]|nr:tetratricopeptide repeat protein [Planctomycetia bacterium]
ARFDPERAVSILRQAIAVDPRNADAYNNLGGTLLALGRRQEAAQAFEACLRIAPSHPQAAENLRALVADPGVTPTLRP